MARSVWFALVAICGQTVEQPDFLQDSLPSDAGYRKNLRDLNPMIGSPVIRPLGIRYRSHLEVGGANRILCGKSGTRHDFWCWEGARKGEALPDFGSMFSCAQLVSLYLPLSFAGAEKLHPSSFRFQRFQCHFLKPFRHPRSRLSVYQENLFV